MNSTLKNITIYFSAILLAKFFGTFRSFFLANILEPSNYGVWITLVIIYSYSPIFSFGVTEALLKQYPFFIGRRDLDHAKQVENGAFTAVILSVVTLMTVYTILLFGIKNYFAKNTLILITIMMVASLINCFYGYFYHRYVARQDFKTVSIIDTLRSILAFSLIVALSYVWGLRGTVIGFFSCEIIICIFIAIHSNIKSGNLKIDFDLKLIVDLIRIGLPITLLWWVFMIQSSVDRIISMSMLGKELTGYYGLGLALASVILLLPQAAGRVLYPRVNEKFGETLNHSSLKSLVIDPTHILSIVLPLFIGIIIIISPIIYSIILPKYSRGLDSAQLLLWGSFFICLIRNGVNFLIAINKQRMLVKFVLLSLMINVVGNITLVKLGFSIEGIAISTVTSGILLTTLIWGSVFRNIGYEKSELYKNLFFLYLPFFLVLAIETLLLSTINVLLDDIYTACFVGLFSLAIFYITLISMIPKYNVLLKASAKHILNIKKSRVR